MTGTVFLNFNRMIYYHFEQISDRKKHCPQYSDKLHQSHYIEVAQGGSPVKHYTIDCEHLAYFEPKKIQRIFFIQEIICTFLFRRYNVFLPMKTSKNCPQKLLIIDPNFLISVLQTGLKTAQSHFLFH